jgi:SAM-dependent methyltransferase
MNSSENDATIQSYEQNAQRYASATADSMSDSLKRWLAMATENLPVNASIFEVGSGTGRDALHLQSLGYTVQCSDATEAFLKQLRQKGLDAEYFNVITDAFKQRYSLILADAVLLHLKPEQTKRALKKIRQALSTDGRFALTLKEGEGDGWTDRKIDLPRYFAYWTEEAIRHALQEAGFTKVDIFVSGPEDTRWINIVCYTISIKGITQKA